MDLHYLTIKNQDYLQNQRQSSQTKLRNKCRRENLKREFLEAFLTNTKESSRRQENMLLIRGLLRRGRVRPFPLWGVKLLLMMLQTPSKFNQDVCKVFLPKPLSKIFKKNYQMNTAAPLWIKIPLPMPPTPSLQTKLKSSNLPPILSIPLIPPTKSRLPHYLDQASKMICIFRQCITNPRTSSLNCKNALYNKVS